MTKVQNTSTPLETYYKSDRDDLLKLYTPQNCRVLDVGCAEGKTWAHRRKELGLEVWGIEMHPESALQAKNNLDHLIVGDVESMNFEQIPPKHFDLIFLADVLEHLKNPWDFLKKTTPLLNDPNGQLLISIPNIRHYRVLKRLILRGRFRYTDSGILDRTHLRFFCKTDMIKMIQEAGYEIVKTSSRTSASWLPKALNLLSFGLLSDFIAEQHQFLARKRG